MLHSSCPHGYDFPLGTKSSRVWDHFGRGWRLCQCVWESLRAFQLHRSVSFSLQGLARGKKSNSSLQPFQTCTDADLQRHQPDCTAFQINSLLCWGRISCSVLLGACSGSWSDVTVYTAMCTRRNISFHGLSAHSGNLHGPRT